MITTQQLIERLQAIQDKAGHALVVVFEKEEELSDLSPEVIVAKDSGQTEGDVVVLREDES